MCNFVDGSPNGHLLDSFRPSITDATHVLASSGESGDAIVQVRFHHHTRLTNLALAVGAGGLKERSAASRAASLRRGTTIVAVPPAKRTRNPIARKSSAYCLGPTVQPKPEMRSRPNTSAARRGGESRIQLKLLISPYRDNGLYSITWAPRPTLVRVMERRDPAKYSQWGSQSGSESMLQNRPKRVRKRRLHLRTVSLKHMCGFTADS